MKKKVKITYLSIKVQQSLIAPTNALRLDLSSFETLREFFRKKKIKTSYCSVQSTGFLSCQIPHYAELSSLSNARGMPGGGGWGLH